MGLQLQPKVQRLYTETKLERLVETLDELHTAASDDALGSLTSLTKAELVAWLHEVLYTAAETLNEIELHSDAAHRDSGTAKGDATTSDKTLTATPLLVLLRKSS
jgi:hypothetical protein